MHKQTKVLIYRCANILSIDDMWIRLQRPQLRRSLLLKLWSVITRERIALESQWRHPRIGKTATDPIRFEKGTLIFETFETNANFWISESDFWQFSKQLFSRFPASFSETVFLSWTTSEDPHKKAFLTKWKKWTGLVIFGWNHRGLKKTTRGRSFVL